MNGIIIPNSKVKEFTRKFDEFNEIVPTELKNGKYFIEEDYIRIKAMVNPKGKKTKEAIDKIKLNTNAFARKILTEEDFKDYEI